MKTFLKASFILTSLCLLGCASKGIRINDSINTPLTQFALKDLDSILKDYKDKIRLEINQAEGLSEQEYQIMTTSNSIKINAGADLGAMYGILDVVEQIKLNGRENVKNKKEKPFIEHRGIKMNIALDGRLPSYDDTGDAAQKNIATMWDMDFWTEYLDDLARNRFNMLTLWSKHPFPSLCRLSDYPSAAMEDVYVFNKPITWEMGKDWEGVDIQDKSNLRKIKDISIEEKIAFWQQVMEHAHNRGVDIVWFTWNIFISPGTGEITEPDSEEALVYMRKAVQEMVELYPYLSGIGVTAGERMGRKVGPYSAAEWMYETYGKGVIAAKETNPNRPFRFIFRRHHMMLPEIQEDFASKFAGEVETSYKYSVARMYSSVKPPIFEREYYPDVKKYDFKCWMNIRNDDIFNFRWGDPDFVRTFLKNMMSYDVSPGFYMGSDGYLWGREFTSKHPDLAGELEIKKHWYRYMLWGRLAFNPDLSNDEIKQIMAAHFPDVDIENLFMAWQYASKIFPAMNNFHWKPGDSMWSIEGCMDLFKGYQTIRDIIDCYTLESDKLMNITDYIYALQAGETVNKITPFELADSLRLCANETNKYLSKLKHDNNESAELKATLGDIQAFAHYGDYYASKITAATYLHMHESLSGKDKESYKEKALEEIENAAESWKKLAQIADSQYKPQLMARTRNMNWMERIADAEKDIEIVKNSTGAEPKVVRIFTTGGTKLEESQQGKLENFLRQNGYEIEYIDGWKVEANATGLKLVLFLKNDLMTQFYTSHGGTYPDDFDEKGSLINEINHKLWLIGNTSEDINNGIDALIHHLEKDIK